MKNVVLRAPVPTPLRQQVVDILRNAITECLFEPGGRLTERALCASLGVSRGTVREGLRQLEAEGLVRITPNKGPMVEILTEGDAREIYAIRAVLEGMACAAAAERAASGTTLALEAHHAAMRTARKAGDFIGLQRAKTRFYEALFAAAGNAHLEALLKQMRARLTLIRGLDVLRAARLDESVRGAGEVLAAIRDRDSEAARKASEAHIGRAADLALEALRQTGRTAMEIN